jgi:hypothetical protein
VPSPLVEQVLSGDNRQLTLLAARGLLPMSPDELVTLQVQLTARDDAEVAQLANEALHAIEARVLVPFLAQDAPAEVQRWFAAQSTDREVIAALLRRRDVPVDVLEQLAPRLTADLQELLLLRQDRITAAPQLLVALEANPQLTNYAARRIREYREHLIGEVEPEAVEPQAGEAMAPVEPVEVPEAEVQAAIEQARRAAAPEGEVDEQTGLSEGQVRQLPVNVRLKLARGAPRTLRQFLIRDTSALVALTVLQSNPLSDQEVEQYSRSRAVVPDVLEAISKVRHWVGKYPVMLGLVNNPRTPLPIALSLMARVAVRDLRNMAKDRNLPEAVRSQAHRLYRVKSV